MILFNGSFKSAEVTRKVLSTQPKDRVSKISSVLVGPVPCTVVVNKQGSRRKYLATRSSVSSFACTAHSFACSTLLTTLTRSTAHLITHSQTRRKVNDYTLFFIRTRNLNLSLGVKVLADLRLKSSFFVLHFFDNFNSNDCFLSYDFMKYM